MFRDRAREGFDLLRSRTGRRWLTRTARQRLYSRRVAIGIRRDMTVSHYTPKAKVPLEVRHLRPDDDLSVVSETSEVAPQRAQERADQRWFLNSELPTPWVAVDPEGNVCFITWLLSARDNDAVKATLGPLLPPLETDEVAIEGAFTAESHRGLGILPDIAARLMDYARASDGARRGVAFIAEWNASSLKAGEKAGWVPFAKREESWILFRRRVRFLPFTAEAA